MKSKVSDEALKDALDAALEAEEAAMGAAEEASRDVMAAAVGAGWADGHAGPEWVAYRDALAANVEKDSAVLERIDYRIMIAAEINKRSEA
jgi:hypothetical protein